jgi:hypothetical protein
MQVTIASQDDFLLATATGRASRNEVLRVFKNVIDTATERGFEKILMVFGGEQVDLPESGADRQTAARHWIWRGGSFESRVNI